MLKVKAVVSFLRAQPYWRLIAAGVVLLLAGIWLATRGIKAASDVPTFQARRGPLNITVLEGGSLQALESQEIKCQVRAGHQGTKILKIVDEGYLVSDEDVKNHKVLVELDSSDLEQQIIQQEIQYQAAFAALIDAQQNYEIQVRQNRSDVMAAEQKVRFARMDLDKFLGENVSRQIVTDCGLDVLLAAASTNDVEEISPSPASPGSIAPGIKPRVPGDASTNGAAVIVPTVLRTISDSPAAVPGLPAGPDASNPQVEDAAGSILLKPVDFSKFADVSLLGDGEAKQKLRKLEDDLQVARKELGQATTTREGTQRLFKKGFVTRNDMERDEIAYENSRLKVVTAETEQALFRKFDFIRQSEDALSKYADSARDLERSRRIAVSKRAQARARLRSAQGQHEVQLRLRNDLQEQLSNCVIRAEKPGLVIYGGGREDFYNGEERIREGATLRERQSIITIPDMSRMAVNVKIHESYIKKIQKGQKARITVDAFPDKVLRGEVTKVAVLPDSQNRWMNPDLKIYNTTVTIEGSQDWIKPGLSAKVEIMVSQIADCIYVPVQAVSVLGDRQVCYIAKAAGSEPRPVEVGEFNDDFIEIRSGLKEGERVCLRVPSGTETNDSDTAPETNPPGKGSKPPAAKPANKMQTAKS